MGLVRTFFRSRVGQRILNDAIGSSRELAQFLSRLNTDTEVGIDVTPENAMMLSTAYACVRVLSEDIAKLPLYLYRRTTGADKEVVTDHWLVDLLKNPNPWQTGFEFREMQQAHLELDGNFYGIKTIVGKEVREILPVPPQRMQVKADKNWQLTYELTMPDGTQQPVPTKNIYHIKGLSLNGFTGISPVGYQRETIGFGIALRKYGSKLFKNGANVTGVLQTDGSLSDVAYNRLKESFAEKYAGLDNAGKFVLLEEGATFAATGMKADEAQFLQSRQYSRSEIAGIYRVPLHMIGDLTRSTNNNIEQQSLDYVTNGLLGRCERNEARMESNLITAPSEVKSLFLEHDLDRINRADFETRMKGWQSAILTGWMTRNEVRARENLNRGPDDLDEFLAPMNMTSSKTLPDPTKDKEVPSDPSQTETGTEEGPGGGSIDNYLMRRVRAIRRRA